MSIAHSPALNRCLVVFLLPALLVLWTALVLAQDLNRSSRYDKSLQSDVKKDSEWRLPLDEEFLWGKEPSTPSSSSSGGRISVEAYDPIQDFAIEPVETPVRRSLGFKLKFQF